MWFMSHDTYCTVFIMMDLLRKPSKQKTSEISNCQKKKITKKTLCFFFLKHIPHFQLLGRTCESQQDLKHGFNAANYKLIQVLWAEISSKEGEKFDGLVWCSQFGLSHAECLPLHHNGYITRLDYAEYVPHFETMGTKQDLVMLNMSPTIPTWVHNKTQLC